MSRPNIIRDVLVALVVFGVVTIICLPLLSHLMMTGSLFPKTIIEELQAPQPVAAINANGLRLADGSTLSLPLVATLPTNSQALRDATAGGVEITPTGEVYGLLKIHHWCGSDPVGRHIARVNLSAIALADGGTASDTVVTDAFRPYAISYTGHGLRVGDNMSLDAAYYMATQRLP